MSKKFADFYEAGDFAAVVLKLLSRLLDYASRRVSFGDGYHGGTPQQAGYCTVCQSFQSLERNGNIHLAHTTRGPFGRMQQQGP